MAHQPWQPRGSGEIELSDISPAMMPSEAATPGEGESFGRRSPDGGSASSSVSSADDFDVRDEVDTPFLGQQSTQLDTSEQIAEGQHFTVRSVLAGLVIGVLIAFSNAYFGLQTGWISGMVRVGLGLGRQAANHNLQAMPAALIGFAFFKTVSRCLTLPFTSVENVLVQTVAGAVGTMPLGCGFVGVMPALEFLLKPEENGPVRFSTMKLIVWGIGLCLFGVVFGMPLRREVIIRERLKFPSGTATALTIGVLHGEKNAEDGQKRDSGMEIFRQRSLDIRRSKSVDGHPNGSVGDLSRVATTSEEDHRMDWKAEIRLLLIAFGISALYTLISYFIPQIHGIPIFGLVAANKWLWTLNPSPAYVGQGIIMGPATTAHMLLGAIIGWGVLSPIAKHRGWAAGPVSDWETGSKGWIVWVSLAIMLADAIVNLGWLLLRPVIIRGPSYSSKLRQHLARHGFSGLLRLPQLKGAVDGYTPLASSGDPRSREAEVPEPDAPPDQIPSNYLILALFLLTILLCAISLKYVFPPIPIHAILLSILLALLLSIMAIRALGETDLNPVSGISKLTQLFFALVIPATNPNAIIINLIAGAVSEAGALQAGDMLQDLKTGHLLGASPKAQFWGQIIGSIVGAVVSALVYKLYTNIYTVPGGLFQVPTAYVWIFTARLVTGKGLPVMAEQYAIGAGIIFVALTMLRIRAQGKWWQSYVPGGIAVAVGMYNTPSFTLARAFGGLMSWYWQIWRGREETPVIVVASGLILGEGIISIVNLALASAKVPHLG